jgi:DnaJ-class molecular chaperone
MTGGGKGDFYARVKVLLPEHLTDQERELFQELRRRRSDAATAETG